MVDPLPVPPAAMTADGGQSTHPQFALLPHDAARVLAELADELAEVKHQLAVLLTSREIPR